MTAVAYIRAFLRAATKDSAHFTDLFVVLWLYISISLESTYSCNTTLMDFM